MASNSTPHHSANLSTMFTKNSSEGIMKIRPQDLNIVWGNDNRYWNVAQKPDSGAELYQVSWLEVTGFVEGTNPDKSYEVGFNISFNPDAFGWGRYPVFILAKKGKQGKHASTKIHLNPDLKGRFDIVGKWDKSKGTSDDGRLYFGLYEVWSGMWKGGLKIHHAFIRELPE